MFVYSFRMAAVGNAAGPGNLHVKLVAGINIDAGSAVHCHVRLFGVQFTGVDLPSAG